MPYYAFEKHQRAHVVTKERKGTKVSSWNVFEFYVCKNHANNVYYKREREWSTSSNTAFLFKYIFPASLHKIGITLIISFIASIAKTKKKIYKKKQVYHLISIRLIKQRVGCTNENRSCCNPSFLSSKYLFFNETYIFPLLMIYPSL